MQMMMPRRIMSHRLDLPLFDLNEEPEQAPSVVSLAQSTRCLDVDVVATETLPCAPENKPEP